MFHYNVTRLYSLQTFDDNDDDDDDDGGGDGGAGGGAGVGDDGNSLFLLSTYFLSNALSTLPVYVI